MTNPAKESEEKAAFAALLLKEPDPFKAALQLYPENTARALRIATEFPKDAEFKAILAHMESQIDPMDCLPTKADLARVVWNKMTGKAENGNAIYVSVDDFAKLGKLYAEIRGFIEKPGPVINNNNNVIVPRAIEVPNHGTNEEWEQAAQRQQEESLNVSRSRH